MRRKKDNTSNYSVYWLAGAVAAENGFPRNPPPEISTGDTYSEYLRKAWHFGFDFTAEAAKKKAEGGTCE